MLKRSLLALALLSTFAAHAADYTEPAMEKPKPPVEVADFSNGSQYLYQPDAKTLALTPQLGLGFVATKFSSNNVKRFEAATPLDVEALSGINHMFAVGVDLGVANIGRTYTCSNKPCPSNTHSRGLDDPKLEFKGRNSFGRHTLRYGADLSLSLEKHKIDSSGDSNMATGGYVLAPWVGYEATLGTRHMLGAKLQYELLKGDRKITDDTAVANTEEPGATPGDQTVSDGKILDLTAFYEMKVRKVTYGVAVHLAHREESRLSVNGAPSTPNRDQGLTTGLKLYVPIELTDRITLLPQAYVDAIAYPNSATYDAGLDFGLFVAGRFTF